MRIYVIDAGNTNIKLGCFENEQLVRVERFEHNQITKIKDSIAASEPNALVISSVVAQKIASDLLSVKRGMVIDAHTKIPILNCYETPQTLGMDRLCNAVGVAKRMDSQFGVSIDIGTCIKFDIVSKTEGYLGGSISPGIDLRYRSLNAFTEKLPLLSNKSATLLVGNNTEASIISGVINGIKAEIERFVHYYESQFSDLTFFVTGGDMAHFDIQSKNDIFAVENLTLHGLFEIYKHNA